MANINSIPAGTLLHNGKYRVQSLISSKGGFGLTYKVVDTSTYHIYAIKEFFMSGINTRVGTNVTVSVSDNQASYIQQKEKFKKEARRLQGIHHPNVIRVHEWFEENDTCYYVMDFIDGESLDEKVNRKGKPLSEHETIKILQSLLLALKTVHQQGIMHMDLKPSNIMIDKAGHVTLIDFGASKQITPEGQHALATSTVMPYTEGYAPGEQLARNLKNIGPWTDFYALGATLYRLQSLQKPPLLDDIQTEGAGAFSFPAQMSTSMKSLIQWMMRPLRTQRPQSVDEIYERMRKTGMVSSLKSSISNDYEKTILSRELTYKQTENEETIINQHKVASSKSKQSVFVFSYIAIVAYIAGRFYSHFVLNFDSGTQGFFAPFIFPLVWFSLYGFYMICQKYNIQKYLITVIQLVITTFIAIGIPFITAKIIDEDFSFNHLNDYESILFFCIFIFLYSFICRIFINYVKDFDYEEDFDTIFKWILVFSVIPLIFGPMYMGIRRKTDSFEEGGTIWIAFFIIAGIVSVVTGFFTFLINRFLLKKSEDWIDCLSGVLFSQFICIPNVFMLMFGL